MCDSAFPRAMGAPPLDSLSITPPNLDMLAPELIVVHMLPYLTNGEKGALARTCGRLFRLLRHERVYRLSLPCTRKYFEDAAFRAEVNSFIPAGKLVLRTFECAIRAFHFAPFEFKRARTLFEEALADERATEVEKARAHLSLFALHVVEWGGSVFLTSPNNAAASAHLVCNGDDEDDPVRAFEMGVCYLFNFSSRLDYDKAHSLLASSANGGCATGMVFICSCLCNGLGVARDVPAAVAQWERAAAMGHFGAMYELGDALYSGRGVSRDEARAVALIRSAAVDEGSWRAIEWLKKKSDEQRRKGL